MTPVATSEEIASQHGRDSADLPTRPLVVPAPFPKATPAAGHHVRIEPADSSRHDVAALWAATHGDSGREATWQFMTYGPFRTERDFVHWFTQHEDSNDPRWYTAVDASTQRPIGVETLMRIRPEHGVVEIGNIWFIPEARATARTTEAIFLLMRQAIHLGYRRLEWKCDTRNAGSRRAALRLGFRFEGVFRNHMVVKGRNRDTAWFSITDAEWPAVDAAISTWLDPANFDDKQHQRTSLRHTIAALW
jgi:RimJ/RimL family protein N-acetyltransferase